MDTARLSDTVWLHGDAPDVGLPPSQLPTELTSFIGREYEIDEVAQRLRGTRLLTLIGAGGIGKTRLALEVAQQSSAEFSDGARFVNLAPVSDPALAAQAVLGGLGLRQERDRPPLGTLVHRLRTRQLLLLLDNCEHLLPACAEVVDALL